jgi:hypothetical protein
MVIIAIIKLMLIGKQMNVQNQIQFPAKTVGDHKNIALIKVTKYVPTWVNSVAVALAEPLKLTRFVFQRLFILPDTDELNAVPPVAIISEANINNQRVITPITQPCLIPFPY